ncbi:MAG: SGNH/GDSL hydrolase family protein [Lachnospiraceae bacterium]|nr:SGNH/GDSL hydrolase family protein [Lachnospiraceae bacterium]
MEKISAFKKIRNGEKVNILIVGDSIGVGYGASDDSKAWPALLKDHIEEKYGAEVMMTNVSLGGESAFAGFVRLLQIDKDIKYDLVFICFGHNDEETDFEIYYEALIRKILTQYPLCSIISIQEHSQKEYTNKMNSILKIANYYRIPVVDTIQPFQEDLRGYDALVCDGTHPNDEGYEIFARAVEEVVDSEILNDPSPIQKKEKPKNIETQYFEKAFWIRVNRFKKDGLKYSIEIEKPILGNGRKGFLSDGNGIVLFSDIVDYPGENILCVYSNGKQIANRNTKWTHYVSQRHIKILGKNISINQGILTVKFEDEKQAESFKGLGYIF